jgi:hypothetical protein
MVAVAASLCNGGIVRTEPRSESRPRRSSRAPLLAVVWGASFARRRRPGAPRVARSDPSLTSRLSRVDTTRSRLLHTCSKSLVLRPGVPKAVRWVFEAPGTNYFGKLAARSPERWLLVARGASGPSRLDSRFGECLDCSRIVDPASGPSSEATCPWIRRLD